MTDAPRSWKYRRRVVFAASGNSIGGLWYLLIWGEGTALELQIAGGLVSVLIAALAIYVGGATADDWLKDREAKK